MLRTLFTALWVFALAAGADYVQLHSAPASSAAPATLSPAGPAIAGQAPRDAVVTVTGCLKPWDDMAGAPAPSSATTAASGGRRYLLTDVDPEPPGEADRVVRPPLQYVVTADAGVDLAAHVNHKVRITGTAAAPPAATRPEPEPKPTKGWGLLTATTITMVSATCPVRSE
jgi:hypothetical protein